MVNKDFVLRKIKLIQEDLGRLEDLEKYSFSQIVADFVKMSAVERLLEKIIMWAIDINQHLIAELGKGDEKVRGYEDTFWVLADLGVYSQDFAKKIAPSAGLRNRLVHEYNDTKVEIIYKSVGEVISRYAKYCHYILKFLSKHSSKK